MTDSFLVTDPFLEEAEHHAWRLRRTASLSREQVARDRCRENAADCSVCAQLIEELDRLLMRAFLDGTGPWA